jgi:hypothetical protein
MRLLPKWVNACLEALEEVCCIVLGEAALVAEEAQLVVSSGAAGVCCEVGWGVCDEEGNGGH